MQGPVIMAVPIIGGGTMMAVRVQWRLSVDVVLVMSLSWLYVATLLA